jgi:hypothetical protein
VAYWSVDLKVMRLAALCRAAGPLRQFLSMAYWLARVGIKARDKRISASSKPTVDQKKARRLLLAARRNPTKRMKFDSPAGTFSACPFFSERLLSLLKCESRTDLDREAGSAEAAAE